MFVLNEDLSIWVTRGDTAFFNVTAENESGELHVFSPGDVVRFKAFAKKDCTDVVLQKDFPVTEETEAVEILLTEQDTKIGGVISKPTEYWYEVELNPFTNPQTIIGYDDEGAKIFKLFPEGKDLTTNAQVEEDIPVVDDEFSLTSERPVQNRIIAKKMIEIDQREFGINPYEIAVANGFKGTVEEWLKSVIFILTDAEKAEMLVPIEESISSINDNIDAVKNSVSDIETGKMDIFGNVETSANSNNIELSKATSFNFGEGTISFNDKQIGISYGNAGIGVFKNVEGVSGVVLFNLDNIDNCMVIKGVGVPSNDTEAANKAYVDATVADAAQNVETTVESKIFSTSNIFSKTTEKPLHIAANKSLTSTTYTKTSSDKVIYVEPLYSFNASDPTDGPYAFRAFAVQDYNDTSGLTYKIFSERGTDVDTSFALFTYVKVHEIG